MKKLVKKLQIAILVLSIALGVAVPAVSVQAATGKTTIAVSSGTVNIGDTVTVTAKAVTESGTSAYAKMTLSYDAKILEFVKCSATYGGGAGGSVTVSIDTFTVTFKAIAAGTCPVYLTASDGVEFETSEELDSMEGSSTNIIVNNAVSENTASSENTGTSDSERSESNSEGTSDNKNESNSEASSENKEEVKLSADNSLKKLSISPGTLSPEFKGNTVNYTATVDYNVTTIAIDAVTSNIHATVESVTGNKDLKVGENTIQIVVKAVNGTTATYTIKVTRKDAEAVVPTEKESEKESEKVTEKESEVTETPLENVGTEDIAFNNGVYHVVNSIPDEMIPAGFLKATINYQGTEYEGLVSGQGNMSLLYLVNADGTEMAGEFAIYDEANDTLSPFVILSGGESYVIPLAAPADTEVPDTYSAAEFTLSNGGTVAAYQIVSVDGTPGEFYTFYGMNSNGELNWYQYDSTEGTYQRKISAFSDSSVLNTEEYKTLENSYVELKKEYLKENDSLKTIIYILIAVLVVLFIIFINVLLHFFRKANGNDSDALDEPKPRKKQTVKKQVPQQKKPQQKPQQRKEQTSVKSEKDIEVFDFNDED